MYKVSATFSIPDWVGAEVTSESMQFKLGEDLFKIWSKKVSVSYVLQ
jgi:hypothetical protein